VGTLRHSTTSAESLSQRALVGAEAMLSPEHLATASCLNVLAESKFLIPPDFVVGGMRAEKQWRWFP